MSKVILEFNGEEERDDIECALNGWRWKSAMWELDQKLRTIHKYHSSIINQTPASGEEMEMAEKLREIIRGILDEHQILLD